MHSLKIGNNDITLWAMVSRVLYKPYSRKNNYLQRAGFTPAFFNIQKQPKEVEIELVIRDQCNPDILSYQQDLDERIATQLKVNQPTWINVDRKYFLGVLEEIEDKDLYDHVLIAKYIALDGIFYGPEKIFKIGSLMNVEGLENTSMAKINISATANPVSVSLLGNTIKLTGIPLNQPIEIDLFNKTAKSAGVHLEHDLTSDYFEIPTGSNTISITNGTGTITLREVVGL